jgi:small subunit ribosomal protein S9
MLIQSVGKRKSSIARVRVKEGNGTISINKEEFNKYIPSEILRKTVMSPLVVAQAESKYDIKITVNGGGKTGQAEAIRHGIARALVIIDEANRTTLKAEGFLTRDSRVKERKKYGLKAARRAPQFSKR